MSNLIKSFRVIEGEEPEEELKIDINDDYVEVSPKIDPELEVLKEHIIDKAKEEANLILEIAKQREAQALEEVLELKNKLLKETVEEAEKQSLKIKEKAESTGYEEGLEKGYKEGYDKGYNEGKSIADSLVEEVLELKADYINRRKTLLKESEESIINLVLEIVDKLVGELNESRDLIVDLVLNGIKNLDPTDNLIIVVSKDDYDTLLDSKDMILAHASLINNLDIKYDINMTQGDCILETEKGNIDISLKDQLQEVKDLLKNILDNE